MGSRCQQGECEGRSRGDAGSAAAPDDLPKPHAALMARSRKEGRRGGGHRNGRPVARSGRHHGGCHVCGGNRTMARVREEQRALVASRDWTEGGSLARSREQGHRLHDRGADHARRPLAPTMTTAPPLCVTVSSRATGRPSRCHSGHIHTSSSGRGPGGPRFSVTKAAAWGPRWRHLPNTRRVTCAQAPVRPRGWGPSRAPR